MASNYMRSECRSMPLANELNLPAAVSATLEVRNKQFFQPKQCYNGLRRKRRLRHREKQWRQQHTGECGGTKKKQHRDGWGSHRACPSPGQNATAHAPAHSTHPPKEKVGRAVAGQCAAEFDKHKTKETGYVTGIFHTAAHTRSHTSGRRDASRLVVRRERGGRARLDRERGGRQRDRQR
jgi:hypothetical protein